MGNEFAALVAYLKDNCIKRYLQCLVGTVVHGMCHHFVDMGCKEVMEFVDDIEVSCILLLVLSADHEVHLLQLVIDLCTLHRKMPSPSLLQDVAHQLQVLWPQTAQHIDRITLDILIVCLNDPSLIGLAREAHPHHPEPFPQVLNGVYVKYLGKGNTEIRGITVDSYHLL